MKKMRWKTAGLLLCTSLVVSLFPIWSTSGTVFAAGASSLQKVKTAGFSQGQRYPVYKGNFSYQAASGARSVFYYSDGYFSYSPKKYNSHLSSFSMCLSLAGFSTGKGIGTSYGSGNVRAVLKKFCSADTIETHYPVPEYYGKKNKISTIGYALGQRRIIIRQNAGKGKSKNVSYILIPVVVRGEGYGEEWAGNVTLGFSGEAAGFSDAAAQVTSGVNAYIRKHHLQSKKIHFLVTGYSRGGACANLTAQRLSRKYGSSSVYAYTFESPQAGTAGKGTCANIHNVIRSSDIVPCLAPSGMGFRRYGPDHIIRDGSSFSAKNTGSKVINDILLWSIRNSEESYRENYVKKKYLCADGKSRTMQRTLQILLPMLNSMKSSDLAGFLLSVSELGSRMETLGFSDQTLSSWPLMSAREKQQTEERLWNMCSAYESEEKQLYEQKGEQEPSLPGQFLSETQMNTLHEIWAPLCDAALSFAASDRDGIDRSVLQANLLSILQAHSAASNLSLVQEQDSYYR